MNILISGGTGLVGSVLVKMFLAEGHSVTVLTTRASKSSDTTNLFFSNWQPSEGHIDFDLFKSHDVIVNLAGANVGERWTSDHKAQVRKSRLDSTTLLVKGCQHPDSTIHTFISTSATGIYPSDGTLCSEYSKVGSPSDFLTSVCLDWESATAPLPNSVRRVIIRLGIVLSPDGGALKAMLPVFKMGLGAKLGSGNQWMSWIHPDDLSALFSFVLNNKHLSGVFNAVSPQPVSNLSFSKALAKALKRPLWPIGVPLFAVKLLIGEGAGEAYKSYRIEPVRLLEAGFSFGHTCIGKALIDLVNKKGH
jgi:uncharacterized protein